MCRSTAAPIMAMVGMAGTAVGIGIAVLKEKADRRSIQREAEAEIAELDRQEAVDQATEIVSKQHDDEGDESKDS